MAKKRVVVSLFCVVVIFSLAGCWLANSPPLYRMHATKYLESHSDMTEREIKKFICKGNVGQERLLELAKSESRQVRVMAAQNKYLPSDHLERMLEDKSWEVVRACSWNPNFTTDMFDKLVRSKHGNVRYYLANHKGLSVENLIVLSKDESSLVRGQVARNPRLPETQMRRLFRKDGRLATVRLEGRWVRAGLAENHNIPMDILITLSKDDDPVVRMRVASNPSLPEIDMRRLFSEKGRAIMNLATRRGLVKNPNTPIDILIELSKDNKKYISSDALRHPRMKQYQKTEQGK